MAKKQRRMSKEELKAPDEIEVALVKFADGVAKHKKLLLIGLGALIAVGVGLSVLSAMSSSSEASAADEFATATAALSSDVGESARPALQKSLVANYPDAASQRAAAKGGLATYAADHAGDDVLELVDLATAQITLADGDADATIAAVDAWLGKHADSPSRVVALELKARATLTKGDKPAALAAYEALAKDAIGPLKVEALVQVGDLNNPLINSGGDAAKAAGAYEQALAAMGPAPKSDNPLGGGDPARIEIELRKNLLAQ
ncbi:MAG: hypothetical protein ACI9MR_001745 [Myxococcota bacterium]